MREDRLPGRPREFDLDATLDQIKDLFWDRGYDAVSLADLMEATGLQKGSLYKAYGDKRSMYLKALARYNSEQVSETVAALDADGDARSRIAVFLEAPILAAYDAMDGRGCFLCNAAADRAVEDPDAASEIRTGFSKIQRAVGAALSDLDGTMTFEEADARAAECLTVYSGLRVLARAGLSRNMLEAARDRVLAGLPET